MAHTPREYTIRDAARFEVILLAAGCSRRLAHLTREIPKSFLTVGGRAIIERNLTTLEALGFERVIAVVGYRQEVFHERIGPSWGKLRLRYVDAADFATTGHGWSLYLARECWAGERRPVLLVHADILYDPRIIAALMAAAEPDMVAVDDHFEARTGDEVLVHGNHTRVSGICKIGGERTGVLGEVVGLNRWSPEFLDELFAFMDVFFTTYGRDHNWEPVVDAFLRQTARPLRPLLTAGLPWININYEDDLVLADQLIDTLAAA